MKRFFTLIVFLALTVILLPWLHPRAEAANQVKVAKFWIGESFYITNDQKVDMDVVPYVDQNDRTLVPLRFLAYALGVPESGVQWDEKTQTATITADGITLKFTVGSNAYTVNGVKKTMDTSPVIAGGRTMLPARFVAEALGYSVAWEPAARAVLIGTPENLPPPPQDGDYSWTVRYEQKEVWISTGTKTADLIYVNMNNPDVEIKPVTADDKIGRVEELASMAGRAGASAAINGSFFNAYNGDDLMPQGTVEIDYKYYHLGSSATLGVDKKNIVHIKELTPHVEGSTDGSWDFPNWWYAWGINHPNPDGIEIFTPDYKDGITPPCSKAIVVRNGVVTEIADGRVEIPEDGYIVWYGENNSERSDQFSIGKKVEYRVVFDEDGRLQFKAALSNAPLLLAGGETALGEVSDPKLNIKAPRSFVGVTWDNVLVMGTVGSASVSELAELTKNLGLKDALNLDGGASSGLYYNGKYIRQPGRQLSNCLVVIAKS
ncbi:MAG: phosphodiester glycosidase family protein [Firmicutes bacterium]|nr:phosphodiester glycosidase family protein [Bacillota bacterium]